MDEAVNSERIHGPVSFGAEGNAEALLDHDGESPLLRTLKRGYEAAQAVGPESKRSARLDVAVKTIPE